MNQRDIEFLRRLIHDRALTRSRGVSSEAMATEHHVGMLKGRLVVYAESDFARAVNLLKSRGIALEVPASYSRGEAPTGQSEKHRAKAVTERYVAVRTLHMEQSILPSSGFLATDWQEVCDWDFDVLLVIENLETLIRLQEYLWLNQYVKGRRALALFRGTVGMFSTAAAADLIHTDARPTLAFYDFDPKGLAMAASLPRREAMCLPTLALLEQYTKAQSRRNLFSQSAQSVQAQLDAESDPQIQAAWRLLQRLNMGLDQEHFPSTLQQPSSAVRQA
ncbi:MULTISPECIES: DUF7281 domain-containing protein [Delftia]|uniref:DUF7281 domain-containing protein n=1 Tax=Delftia deserti TaxID=1651218 RepID=A0ABW5EQH3_9BURK|nr:hypothetical protein [Delftia sp. UME58]